MRLRFFILALVLGLAAVACSDDGASDPVDSEDTSSSESPSTATASEPPDGDVDGDDEPADVEVATRTVEHAFGSSDVPVEPQRILVIGWRGVLPALLDLGFEPIASQDGTTTFGSPFHPLVTARAEEAGVETYQGENLEQIAALEPDLIIGAADFMSESIDQLDEIAPSIGIDWDFENPLNNIQAIGDAMGVGQRAAADIEDFQSDFERFKERLDDPGQVSIASFFSYDDLRVVRSGGNWVVTLVLDLGAEIVPTEEELPADPELPPGFNFISLEQVGLLSGESLILTGNSGPEFQAALEEILAETLVQQLPAVQRDRVLQVDVQLTSGAAGLEGMRVVLDDLETFFLDG